MNPLPEINSQDGKPIILSYFQLNDYITCPKRFGHRHYFKNCPQENKSRQQTTGIDAHDAIKRRIKLNEPLPSEYESYESVCKEVFEDKGRIKHVELALGCTADARACSFFDDRCCLRARLDLALVASPRALVIDWKTGKPWEDPFELRLQALLLKIHMPDLEVLTANYYWLKENRLGIPYNVSDVEKTWETVHRYAFGIQRRIVANDWPPDEGPLCGYCPVSYDQCAHKREPKK